MSETKTKAKGGAAAKVLMPVVATLASAVASYLAKKAPQYLEQTLLPKLRETKDAAGGVGDVAHDLAERAKSVVVGEEQSSSHSADELEQRRRERADHRAARRKTA
jgi:hypothetical protein